MEQPIINGIFQHDIEMAATKFDRLKVVERSSEMVLAGKLDIVDPGGKIWETFEVEMLKSPRYPYEFPHLFETGGKIPKIADWHVYDDTKACCVDVKPNEIIICAKGLHVIDYIERYAIPYFANQTHRILEGYYKYGEYSHGVLGLAEFYLDILNTKNIKEGLKWMYAISEGLKPLQTSMCFCGKKIKYRYCHRDAVRKLQIINSLELKNHIGQITAMYTRNTEYFERYFIERKQI